MSLLDYGTGSGILSIYAAKKGSNRCVAIDIDEETLVSARNNVLLNKVEDIVKIMHTREIYIDNTDSLPKFDITVANILPGPLYRLVAPICLLTKPGGFICISGLRSHELPAIRRYYLFIIIFEVIYFISYIF